MEARFNRLACFLFATAVVLTVFGGAYAHDDPYKAALKHIEHNYKAKKSGVPFLGVANFVLKFWHPAGVKSIKIALFNDQDLTPRPGTPDFDSVVTASAAGGWHALARVYSRTRGEWTYVYYTGSDKDMKILVASLEPQSAFVAQVRFDAEKLVHFVQNPTLLGIKLADDIRRGPSQDNNASGPVQSVVASNATQDDGDSNGASVSDFSSARGPHPAKSVPPRLIRTDDPNYVSGEYRPVEFAFPPAPAPKSESSETSGERAIKLKTTLVNLNVQAMDKTGRPVTGLAKDDFAISENGKRQNITYFAPDTSPVSVLLLLDLSGSTKRKAKTMKEAAKRFVQKLSDGDSVAVATFTRKFRLVSDFTSDRRAVEKRIGDIKNREGGTAYYDAMWTAFDMTERIAGARKAIIVLTDGVDNSLQNPREWPTRHAFSELADRAAEDEVTVYPIYMDTEHDKRAWVGRRTGSIYKEARGELQRLADDTAGTLYRVSTKDDLKNVYDKVAAELHTIYTLAYTPQDLSSDGGFRKIDVSVKEQGIVTRTRKGYFAK